MADFETHRRGAYDEIKASRELAREIEQTIEQWGEGIIPLNILQAYKRLRGQYIRQIETENI